MQRGSRRFARQLPQPCTELLLLGDGEVLIGEEDDATVRDESGQIFDEFIRVGCSEEGGELDGGIRETGPDHRRLIVVRVGVKRAGLKGGSRRDRVAHGENDEEWIGRSAVPLLYSSACAFDEHVIQKTLLRKTHAVTRPAVAFHHIFGDNSLLAKETKR
jgi:hypothetical protein